MSLSSGFRPNGLNSATCLLCGAKVKRNALAYSGHNRGRQHQEALAQADRKRAGELAANAEARALATKVAAVREAAKDAPRSGGPDRALEAVELHAAAVEVEARRLMAYIAGLRHDAHHLRDPWGTSEVLKHTAARLAELLPAAVSAIR